jgi:hypothetical protein
MKACVLIAISLSQLLQSFIEALMAMNATLLNSQFSLILHGVQNSELLTACVF